MQRALVKSNAVCSGRSTTTNRLLFCWSKMQGTQQLFTLLVKVVEHVIRGDGDGICSGCVSRLISCDQFNAKSVPCCGVPLRTPGKGEFQTDLRAASSAWRFSSLMRRSAWLLCVY